MKNKPWIYSLMIIFSMSTLATSSQAEVKAEDQIKFRQSAMTFMRWNVGVIKKQIVDHPETYNKEQIIAAANVIAAIANSDMGNLFGPQTASGKGWKETRLKPEYFQQADKVKEHSDAFRQQANALASIARSNDIAAIKTQFGKLHESCKSCHKSFREK